MALRDNLEDPLSPYFEAFENDAEGNVSGTGSGLKSKHSATEEIKGETNNGSGTGDNPMEVEDSNDGGGAEETGAGDAVTIDQNSGDSGHSVVGIDSDDESSEYDEAMKLITELEKKKKRLQSEEEKLRSALEEKEAHEKQLFEAYEAMEAECDTLKASISSLGEDKGKLVDHLDLLLEVDTEMAGFAKLNQDFNVALEEQLKAISDKHEKISSLKPIIQGKDQDIDCSLGKSGLKNNLITILAENITELQDQIKGQDPGNLRTKQSEWEKVEFEEKTLRSRIKSFAEKIAKKEKAQKLREARASKRRVASKDDDSTPKKTKRGDEDDAETLESDAGSDQTKTSNRSGRRSAGSGRASTGVKETYKCQGCMEMIEGSYRNFAYHCFRGCEGFSNNPVQLKCNSCEITCFNYVDLVNHEDTVHPKTQAATTRSRRARI